MHATYSVVLDRGLTTAGGGGGQQTVLPVDTLAEARALLGEIVMGSSPHFVARGRRTDVLGVREDHVILVTKGRFGAVKEMARARIVVALAGPADRNLQHDVGQDAERAVALGPGSLPASLSAGSLSAAPLSAAPGSVPAGEPVPARRAGTAPVVT